MDVATTATDAAATASESEPAPATTPEIVAHEPAAPTPSPAAATSVSPAPTISTPPAAPVADAAIAERISIPGGHSNDATTDTSDGGEWELLTSKIKNWFDANDIGEQINRARQPLRLLAYFIGLLLVLKVYSGLLGAIGSIPLAPRLLELVGLCSVISFSATRLVRSNDRREVIDGLRQRWSAFSGSKN